MTDRSVQPVSTRVSRTVPAAKVAQEAAGSLDGRIKNEYLNGMAEAVAVREVLDKVQTLNLEVSEELDAYQNRHPPRR
jgi:hypothetical protein